MSFILKEGKKQLCFYIWPCYSALYIFLSELKSWSQPTAIYLPVKQEECLLLVWIAVYSLVWMASQPAKFYACTGTSEVQ